MASQLDEARAHGRRVQDALARPASRAFLAWVADRAAPDHDALVYLPRVPMSGLTAGRFPGEGPVSTVPRALMREVFAACRAHRRLYLQGPRGCGKSHALLAAVCALRAQPRTRVVYLQDSSEWVKGDGFQTFFEEFAGAFHDVDGPHFAVVDGPVNVNSATLLDIGSRLTMDEWLFNVRRAHREARAVSAFLQSVIHNIVANGETLYIVVDQHNAISAEKKNRTSPFDLPTLITSLVHHVPGATDRVHVVVSASANNEARLRDFEEDRGWDTLLVPSTRPGLLRFTRPQVLRLIEAGSTRVPCADAVLDRLDAVTGFLPLEIVTALRFLALHGRDQSVETALQALYAFENDRIDHYKALHRKFRRTLIDDEVFDLNEAVSRMMLGLPCTLSQSPMDMQLMYIERAQNSDPNDYRTRALTPSAFSALCGALTASIARIGNVDSPVSYLLNVLQRRGIPGSVKGYLVEHLILTQMRVAYFAGMDIVLTVRRGPDGQAQNLRCSPQRRIEFTGLRAPSGEPPRDCTLFEPSASNYPGVDFLLYVPASASEPARLWCFQVTLQSPQKHGFTFFELAGTKRDADPTTNPPRSTAAHWYSFFHPTKPIADDGKLTARQKEFFRVVWMLPREQFPTTTGGARPSLAAEFPHWVDIMDGTSVPILQGIAPHNLLSRKAL